MRRILIFLLVLATSAFSEGPAAIEQAYGRSGKAMALKFIDGVHSIRDRQFELFDSDGLRVPMAVERAQLQNFLRMALKVEESHQTVDWTPTGLGGRCKVHYKTRATFLDRLTKKRYQWALETDCLDEWVLRGQKWKLLRSRILRQETVRAEAR